MRIHVHIVCWIGQLFAISQAACSEEAKVTFLREFPRAIRNVEDVYARLHLKARITRHAWDSLPTVTTEVELMKYDSRFRVVVTRTGDAEGERLGETSVWLAGSEQLQPSSFILHRFPNTDTFVIDSARASRVDLAESLRTEVLAAYAPYCIGSERISDLLQQRSFAIKDASPIEHNGEQLIKVDWDWPQIDSNQGRIERHGWVLLAPAEKWTVQEMEMKVATPDDPLGSSRHLKLRYEGKSEDVPLVKDVSYWKQAGDSDERLGQETTVVTYIAPIMTLDEEAFLLSSFGIEPSGRSNSRIMVILFANTCVVLAIVLWYAARKLRYRNAER